MRWQVGIIPANSDAPADSSMYRSVGTASWTENTSLEVSTNGGGSWAAAGCWPTAANDTIQIRSGACITIDANISVDQTTINTAALVTVNNGTTLTVANDVGADPDLTVNGTLVNAGTVTMTGTGFLWR